VPAVDGPDWKSTVRALGSIRWVSGDDVNIEVAGPPDDVVDHRALGDFGPPRPPARPHHQLGGVVGGGEPDQGFGDLDPGHVVKGATQLLEKEPIRAELLRRRASA